MVPDCTCHHLARDSSPRALSLLHQTVHHIPTPSTGAGIIVLCESEADIICDHTKAVPLYVVGGRTLNPLCGGTLPFRYKSSPSPYPIPFLDAYFGPRTPSGLGAPTAAHTLHAPHPVHAVRPSSGALWRSADRVCETLNIWNPADLARYPHVMRGVKEYPTH